MQNESLNSQYEKELCCLLCDVTVGQVPVGRLGDLDNLLSEQMHGKIVRKVAVPELLN